MAGDSSAGSPPTDTFRSIHEHEEQIEQLADREDRIGAIARYFLAAANGEHPTDYDAELAGLPKLGGGDKQ